ncbi:hypothetical protein [Flavobacterium sp.]
MVYILHGDSYDPGMRYEGLARYAFDCGMWGGPNNVAHQSVYNGIFIPHTNAEGVLVLTQILDALIAKTDNCNKIEEYENLKTSITSGMEQRTAIQLIDYILQIIQQD